MYVISWNPSNKGCVWSKCEANRPGLPQPAPRRARKAYGKKSRVADHVCVCFSHASCLVSQMSQDDSQRGNEVGDTGANDRLRLERIASEAARSYEEARRAIDDGGLDGLLVRAHILKTDITSAILDRYTEDAIVQISTASLTLLDDKGPLEFFTDGFW